MKVTNFGEDFGEAFCGAGGGILLESMVHLDDLEVEGRTEDLGGFAGEPEEGVDAHAVVRCEDDRDERGSLANRCDLIVGVSGGADDECAPLFDAGIEDGVDDGVMREIDHGVTGCDAGGKIVPEVDGCREGEVGIFLDSGDERGAHATFGAVDEGA